MRYKLGKDSRRGNVHGICDHVYTKTTSVSTMEQALLLPGDVFISFVRLKVRARSTHSIIAGCGPLIVLTSLQTYKAVCSVRVHAWVRAAQSRTDLLIQTETPRHVNFGSLRSRACANESSLPHLFCLARTHKHQPLSYMSSSIVSDLFLLDPDPRDIQVVWRRHHL